MVRFSIGFLVGWFLDLGLFFGARYLFLCALSFGSESFSALQRVAVESRDRAIQTREKNKVYTFEENCISFPELATWCECVLCFCVFILNRLAGLIASELNSPTTWTNNKAWTPTHSHNSFEQRTAQPKQLHSHSHLHCNGVWTILWMVKHSKKTNQTTPTSSQHWMLDTGKKIQIAS